MGLLRTTTGCLRKLCFLFWDLREIFLRKPVGNFSVFKSYRPKEFILRKPYKPNPTTQPKPYNPNPITLTQTRPIPALLDVPSTALSAAGELKGEYSKYTLFPLQASFQNALPDVAEAEEGEGHFPEAGERTEEGWLDDALEQAQVQAHMLASANASLQGRVKLVS